jgi:hypothetical protein
LATVKKFISTKQDQKHPVVFKKPPPPREHNSKGIKCPTKLTGLPRKIKYGF